MKKKIDGDSLELILIVAVVIAGIFGFMHAAAGAVVGGIEGAGIAVMFSMGPLGLIVLVLLGAFIGLIARFVLEVGLSAVSGGGGFSGGGGGFGGGGANG